jgi:hypothetical protein
MNDQHDSNNIYDGRHDFDFLMGRWTVSNERLTARLQGSTDWEEFEATSDARPLLGGMGNTDEFKAEQWRPGYIGMSLRFFSPAAKAWSIYWIDNRSVTLEKPVVGGFTEGIGIFEGDDLFDGKPIRVRFQWTVIDRDRPTWEQAFSGDDGKTWETNWIMRFRRVAAA